MTQLQFILRMEELQLQFRMIGVEKDKFDWARQRAFEYAITTIRPNSDVIIEKLEYLREMILTGNVRIDEDWNASLKIASQNG